MNARVVNADETGSVRAAKKAMRAEVSEALAAMTQAERDRATDAAIAQLECSERWRDARRIMIYAPMIVEPSLDRWWTGDKGAPGGKTVSYPRTMGRELEARVVRSLSQLKPAALGLREPDPVDTERIDPDHLDLVIVPGLAFTSRGDRLGRGAGYYDRFLAELSPRVATVAFAFRCQIRDHLPIEPHDRRVDAVLVG